MLRRPAPRHRFLLAVVLVVAAIALPRPVGAAPTQDRARVGYADVATNGFGGTNSWAGSLGLYTGHDQTGEYLAAYCIQRGLDYPRGTDPQFADANSGFTVIGDVPAERGVPAEERAAIAYSLWRYGATTDDRTAAAMFLLTHLQSGDDDFGSTTLAATVLGADWPDPAGVMARAVEIRAESLAQRGPWTMAVDVIPAEGNTMRIAATLRGPGGPIRDVDLALATDNADGDGTARTDGDGRVVRTVTATDPALPVSATATRVATPGYYRVFEGRANTQQVITSGGDGAPVSATDSATVPPGAIRIVKTTTNPAYQSGEGATYEVRRGAVNGPVVGTVAIGPDGVGALAGLVPGRHVVTEVSAPAGQVLDPTSVPVEVVAGQTQVVERTNQTTTDGELRLVKTDGETGETLAGAQFTVAYDADRDGTFETPIGTEPWVTTADPAAPVVVGGLAIGDYQVTEVAPPPGYTRPDAGVGTQIVAVTVAAPTVTMDIENRRPRLVTQVVTAAGTPTALVGQGAEVADVVQIDNVATDTTALVTARLYGPFATDADIDCGPDALAAQVDFTTVGSGTSTSPPVTLDQSGVYTFVSTAVFDDGSSATHACGEATETVAVPGLTTAVSAPAVVIGEAVVDVASVVGVRDGMRGRIDAVAYGPFESTDAMVCTAEAEAFRASFDVVGSGPFSSPEFEPALAGIYTFVATWTAVDDETVTATHACGEVAETVTVAPVVATQVSLLHAYAGESVFDTALVVGVPDGMDGAVSFGLYGPLPADGPVECTAATLVATAIVATDGPVPVESTPVRLDRPGRYSYVATWTSASGAVTASHDCGLVAETVTVAPPGVTTVAAGPGPAVRSPRPSTPAAPALARTGSSTVPMTLVGVVAVLAGGAVLAWLALAERRRFRDYWVAVRMMSK